MVPAAIQFIFFLSLFVAKNKCRKWWRDSLLFSLIHSVFACLFRIVFFSLALACWCYRFSANICTLVCELSALSIAMVCLFRCAMAVISRNFCIFWSNSYASPIFIQYMRVRCIIMATMFLLHTLNRQ